MDHSERSNGDREMPVATTLCLSGVACVKQGGAHISTCQGSRKWEMEMCAERQTGHACCVVEVGPYGAPMHQVLVGLSAALHCSAGERHIRAVLQLKLVAPSYPEDE